NSLSRSRLLSSSSRMNWLRFWMAPCIAMASWAKCWNAAFSSRMSFSTVGVCASLALMSLEWDVVVFGLCRFRLCRLIGNLRLFRPVVPPYCGRQHQVLRFHEAQFDLAFGSVTLLGDVGIDLHVRLELGVGVVEQYGDVCKLLNVPGPLQ